MRNQASVYAPLRAFIETIPLADGHDHSIALPGPGEGADPVGFKDQTAYGRDIGYGNPTRHVASAWLFDNLNETFRLGLTR